MTYTCRNEVGFHRLEPLPFFTNGHLYFALYDYTALVKGMVMNDTFLTLLAEISIKAIVRLAPDSILLQMPGQNSSNFSVVKSQKLMPHLRFEYSTCDGKKDLVHVIVCLWKELGDKLTRFKSTKWDDCALSVMVHS